MSKPRTILDEIQEAQERATGLPWQTDGRTVLSTSPLDEENPKRGLEIITDHCHPSNAHFIVIHCNKAKPLLAVVRAAEVLNDEWERCDQNAIHAAVGDLREALRTLDPKLLGEDT